MKSEILFLFQSSPFPVGLHHIHACQMCAPEPNSGLNIILAGNYGGAKPPSPQAAGGYLGVRRDGPLGRRNNPFLRPGRDTVEGYPVLMSLQLDGAALAQVPSHVCQSLRAALAVSVVSGKGPHQLLSCPLSVLRGQPGGEAASRQGVGQLQWPCSRRTRAKMGIQWAHTPA